jgi:hypothetical protein
VIDTSTAISLMRGELQRVGVKRRRNTYKKEGTCRCPFCGDSKKDLRDEHLYMKLSPDSRDGFAYFSFHCKLCGESRKVINAKDFRAFGFENQELLDYILSLRKASENRIVTSRSNVLAKRLLIPLKETDFAEKRKYMADRLGSDDIALNPWRYKIIYDLRQFFIDNKLRVNHEYGNVKEMLRILHENCVGFISFDNTHINFRDITGKTGRRYTQYMIYPNASLKNSETSGIYIIPTNIDAMSPELNVVMAEGSFDILRVYSDFYKASDNGNTVFASVSNAHSYTSLLKKFLEFGFMFDSVTIYSDSDVDKSAYENGVRPLVPDARLTVYYNDLEKDFGNIKDPLKLRRITL